MKLLSPFLFSSLLLTAHAEDVVCTKKMSKVVTVADGDIFSYKTQTGEKYQARSKCKVTYMADSSCPSIKFSCSEFDLANTKSNCKGGDKLNVIADGKSKKFCQNTSPSVTAKKKLKVVFSSNKKVQSSGAVCTVECVGGSENSTPGSGNTPAPPPGPTIANPGSAASTTTFKIKQTWSQETDYDRTAEVSIPATSAGEKVPVVIHLHGNGGQGNTNVLGSWLGDIAVIVSATGYERSWNVVKEKSKADDVTFILDLIAKVGAEIPAADMNNVAILGTSNGAALTYRLMIETGKDRPFRKVFPMVSSLVSAQYRDGQFWKSTTSEAPGEPNVYDTAVVPEFADDFVYMHFHGTEDGLIKYDGQSPGPSLLGPVDVIAAQETDYLFAKAMGYTGSQLPDSAGVSVGLTADKQVEEYSYLDGRAKHYKLVGEGHGTGPSHDKVREVVKAA